MKQFEIRADYDRETIVVYQAYRPAIAEAAVAAQRFVNPFSLNRMTWIKPSFLWMMHRSGWASTPGQERVVAVRITRAGWEEALSLRDAKLDHRSIQVGLSRDIITRYVNDWTVEIRDLTPLAHEISAHLRSGHVERAEALLPHEVPYPLDDALAKTIGAG